MPTTFHDNLAYPLSEYQFTYPLPRRPQELIEITKQVLRMVRFTQPNICDELLEGVREDIIYDSYPDNTPTDLQKVMAFKGLTKGILILKEFCPESYYYSFNNGHFKYIPNDICLHCGCSLLYGDKRTYGYCSNCQQTEFGSVRLYDSYGGN